MPSFFLNKRLIILLISVIVVVGLIGFSISGRDSLTWPEQFIRDSVGVVQSVLHRPAQFIGGIVDNIIEIRNVYEENKILKARLDEFVMIHAKLQEIEAENEELRAILDKKETLRDYTVIQATVIARSPDRWNELITINKGSQDGIEENMAVITAKGMIGKVTLVSPFTSTVQLLSDINRTNRISVIVKGKEDVFGLIEGYDSEKRALLFNRIPHDVEVNVGDTVITSGYGGVFPNGLVIGEIIEVVQDDYGLTQTAFVKPAADFYKVNNVMVIKRTLPTIYELDVETQEGETE